MRVHSKESNEHHLRYLVKSAIEKDAENLSVIRYNKCLKSDSLMNASPLFLLFPTFINIFTAIVQLSNQRCLVC